jgi:hypothetical protein
VGRALADFVERRGPLLRVLFAELVALLNARSKAIVASDL